MGRISAIAKIAKPGMGAPTWRAKIGGNARMPVDGTKTGGVVFFDHLRKKVFK